MTPRQSFRKSSSLRTILHCPRCQNEFRREYVPASALNDARAERDRYREALEEIARHWGCPAEAPDCDAYDTARAALKGKG